MRSVRVSRRDATVAAVVTALALLELRFGPAVDGATAGHAVHVLLVTTPLAWRTAAPLAAATVSCGSFCIGALLLPSIELLVVGVVALLVMPYTVAVGAPTWRAAVTVGLLVATLLGLQGAWDEQFGTVGAVVANVTFAALGWGVGAVVRRVEVRSRARLVEARSQAARTVQDERAQIARDLHDVVAHALTVITVQAGGARKVLHDEPELAARALSDIQTVSRRAMVDMRQMLDVLRQPGAPSSGVTDPVRRPRLVDLDDLVAPLRQSGLRVDVHHEGEPLPLSPGTETAAVRIIQEALTNALRHSGAGLATLAVRWRHDGLELEVTDDGGGLRDRVDGHGLVGMRERVLLLDGDLEVGSAPEGGTSVRAWLPVPDQSRVTGG
jgi:signal transduction histidine kinase